MMIKREVGRLVAILFLIIVSGCSMIFHKSKMHLADEMFDISRLTFRIDGYYYMVKEYDHRSVGIKPIIFYNNGYVRKVESLHGLKSYRDEREKDENIELALKNLENDIINDSFHVKIQNTIWDWGLYKEYDDRRIIIQSYSNHFGDYRLVDWTGHVLNDTTILLKHKYGYKFHNVPKVIDEEIYELYRFRAFSSKPDSINYIMNHRTRFGNK